MLLLKCFYLGPLFLSCRRPHSMITCPSFKYFRWICPVPPMWFQIFIWERNVGINRNIRMYWSSKSSCKTFHTYPDKIMMIFTWLFIDAMTSTYPYFLPHCYKDLLTDTEDGISRWWLCIHSVTLLRKWEKCTLLYKGFWTKLWNISNKTVSGAHCIWASKRFPLVYFFLICFPFCGCFILNFNGVKHHPNTHNIVTSLYLHVI